MRTFWKWMVVFGAATAVDLFARFGLSFQMTRVLLVEAILFPVSALLFLKLMRAGPEQTGFRRKLQIGIVAAFILAGLRSGLWAAGLPIGIVNLSVLAAALFAWLAYRWRRQDHS